MRTTAGWQGAGGSQSIARFGQNVQRPRRYGATRWLKLRCRLPSSARRERSRRRSSTTSASPTRSRAWRCSTSIPTRPAAVADEHGAGKATAARVDARDVDALAGAIAGAGADVLLNTASYRINLDAMRACLKAGCHYLDLGGLYHVTRDQLELAARVRAGRAAGGARDRVEPGQDQPDGRGRGAPARRGGAEGIDRSTSSPPAATRRRRPTDGSAPRTRSRR